MTYAEALQRARSYLKEHDIADADVDAWYLLAHVLRINSRAKFYLTSHSPIPEDKYIDYMDQVKKRGSRYPLQYITGTQEFMGIEFKVSEDVLIPRQDTETLVEEVLRVCQGKDVLDMCTGSGCIIISLALLGKPNKAIGADISVDALRVAEENARKHKVKVDFYHSNLFDNISEEYDIIVSNPPYIPTQDIEELMPEVKEYEPHHALDGDRDGLKFYRLITLAAKKHLKESGYLFYEIGYNQGTLVRDILLKEGFCDITIKKDLSGLDRVVSARKPTL